jgi:hypothetical protein
MTAWLEIHQGLPDHPKTFALAQRLDICNEQAVGHLLRLWHWAMDNAPDGIIIAINAQMIADVMHWRGDARQLVDALTARMGAHEGWLAQREDGAFIIHDWSEYAGRLVERRRQDAARKRMARDNKSAGISPAPLPMPHPDVRPLSDGCPADVQRYRTEQNRTEPTNTPPAQYTGTGVPPPQPLPEGVGCVEVGDEFPRCREVNAAVETAYGRALFGQRTPGEHLRQAEVEFTRLARLLGELQEDNSLTAEILRRLLPRSPELQRGTPALLYRETLLAVQQANNYFSQRQAARTKAQAPPLPPRVDAHILPPSQQQVEERRRQRLEREAAEQAQAAVLTMS